MGGCAQALRAVATAFRAAAGSGAHARGHGAHIRTQATPGDARAPSAMNTTDMTMPEEGVSRPAANSAPIVITGVKA